MSRIQKAVEYFTDKIYEDNKLEEERKLMAVRLKEEGVSDEVIQKCIWGK